MKRLPNLDCLRFFLASIVMLFHIPQLCRNQNLPYFNDLPIFNRGTEAVYMFFVLSGFLIIRGIYTDKSRGTFSIKHFYVKRMLRIFPLYYLILVFGFIFYHAVLPALGIDFKITYDLWDGLLLTTFFLPNVFATLYDPGGILGILWSIGIEEQFYMGIAPLLFFVRKNYILQVLVLLTIISFILFTLRDWSLFRDYAMVYFYLFFGGFISILEKKNRLTFLKTSFVIPLSICVITLAYFFTDILKFDNLAIHHGTTMLLFGVFIHSIAHNNLGLSIRNKFLNYLGRISYGIYMYHVIGLNITVFLFLKIGNKVALSNTMTIVLIYILTFVITILLAHISYKYYETYFLKMKTKFRI